MKRIFASIVALCVLATAQAHGNLKPEHGGMVRASGETAFELVTRDDGVELYMKDDDGGISTAGLTAKLTVVTASGEKKEVVLAPAGGNKFAAQGVQIASGSRVAVQVTLADKESKIGTSFVIK